jgi:hypothetical protein
MIKDIWLCPPLAFARVGSSPTPCQNFEWGPDDLSVTGTARTRIVGAQTLHVAKNGVVTASEPKADVVFKDKDGFRPVSPFFEVHGAWTENGVRNEGPLTLELLQRFNLSADDLKWKVKVANHKAFHFTDSPGDRIEASLEIPGGDFARHALEGCSPPGRQSLVPRGKHIPLGSVQATQPTDDFNEFRLRFTPPAGKVYAPSNTVKRLAALKKSDRPVVEFDEIMQRLLDGGDAEKELDNFLLSINSAWNGFALPEEQCLLNPRAAWPKYTLVGLEEVFAQITNCLPRVEDFLAVTARGDRSELIRTILGPRHDIRNLPPSVFAFAAELPNVLTSLGMVDDMADGTISVELGKLAATARVVIAPPSFAPDRRLPVSIADGLADRVDRDSVRQADWVTGDNRADADAEVHDLLDRAFETVGLQNVDAVVDFFRTENANMTLRRGSQLTRQQASDMLWSREKLNSVEVMPLTEIARHRHRRNTARFVFELFAREARGWFERAVRPPAGPERFYDKRMPGLMRGSDRYPLHLTRRQYELLKAWSKRESGQ